MIINNQTLSTNMKYHHTKPILQFIKLLFANLSTIQISRTKLMIVKVSGELDAKDYQFVLQNGLSDCED